jgi:hypothetical protein
MLDFIGDALCLKPIEIFGAPVVDKPLGAICVVLGK